MLKVRDAFIAIERVGMSAVRLIGALAYLHSNAIDKTSYVTRRSLT